MFTARAVQKANVLEEANSEATPVHCVQRRLVHTQENKLVHFGLKLQLEERHRQPGASSLSKVYKVAHALERLQQDVWVLLSSILFQEALRQEERDFNAVGILADQKPLSLGVIDPLNELHDVRSFIQTIKADEATLYTPQKARCRWLQFNPPGARFGSTPCVVRALASGSEPVRSQRS